MWLEEFTPLVGRTILADCTPTPVSLTLIEAVSSRHPGNTDRPSFSLLFRSAPDALLVSGAYAIRCGNFGPEVIHLSPTLQPRGAEPGYYYQAIFN